MGTISYDFDGETVIVTGGSSGIGRQIALEFGSADATVLVADIQKKPRDSDTAPTHEVINDSGGSAEFVQTDVSDPEQIKTLVETARQFSGVDIMVNNAGIVERKDFFDVTAESLDRLHGVNVRGVLLGCKYASQDMLARDEPGVILNTSSPNSDLISTNHIEYDATKGAVRMITRSAAYQLAEYDIRVNAIAPGLTPTQLSEGGAEAAKQAIEDGKLHKTIPMRRPSDPNEIATPSLMLCSDAASYITGEQLYIDGGYQVV